MLCCGSDCCKKVVDGPRVDWLDWPGWLHAGWSLLLLYCRSPDRAVAAVGGPIAEIGVFAAALVTAFVVEKVAC